MKVLSDKPDLKKLENKALAALNLDGLFEIMIGLIIFGFGFGPYFREVLPEPLNYFLWPLIITATTAGLNILLKLVVVKPRLGRVKFQPKKSRNILIKFLIFFIVNTSILVIVLILTVSGIFSTLPIHPLLVGLGLGLLFGALPLTIIAYLLKFNRMYIIAIIIGFTFFFTELLQMFIGDIGWSVGLLIVGSIIVVMGIIIFIKFLREHPKPEKEML